MMLIRAALLSVAAIALTAAGSPPPRSEVVSSEVRSSRPASRVAGPRNVIFVLVDDLRFDSMGFLRPSLQTPNIDRLAEGGSYFPNAVVTSSLCSPSRATILTGQSVRNHGVVDNTNSSEEGLTFFPSYLQQHGYQTAFIGKWHMGTDSDAPRPGFDKWVSFKGQGRYFPATGPRAQPLNVDGEAVAQTGYITDELTDYAMNWLETERDPEKPFFLYLSHKAAHSDPLPPPRYAHQYDGVDFPIPASSENIPENYRGKPMWVYNQRNSWHGLDFMYNTDVKMTDYLRNYYATLSAVDDSIGRVLRYLRENNLEQDTMVVFTSDNGFLIGDHGLIDKRNAYQGSIRVPLLIYAPGLVPAGVSNPGRVSNLDYAPTFLEIAGAPKPPQLEGQSALSLMSGGLEAARSWQPGDFIYEYYWESTFPMTPGTFAIERDGFKYIQYYGVYDLEELYNLSEDPDEMHNLIEDLNYDAQKIILREALFRQLANAQGRHAIPFSERSSRGVVRRNRAGTGAAQFPESWLVSPNAPDRMDDIVPDSSAKTEAHKAGRPLLRAATAND